MSALIVTDILEGGEPQKSSYSWTLMTEALDGIYFGLLLNTWRSYKTRRVMCNVVIDVLGLIDNDLHTHCCNRSE